MKYIITILLLSIGLYSYSQDSTKLTYVNFRGNFFIKASNVPAWRIDGYNAIIYGGDTLIRARESGVFSANELKIYADGTSMSSQINTVFNLSFVKEVKFSSDSTRIFYASDSIDLQGKIATFENGTQIRALSGNLKIKNPIINAPLTVQIFDTSVVLDNAKTSMGYVSVMWWGAKGNNSDNDRHPIQKASNTKNSIIKFPVNYNFRFDSTISIDPTSFVDMLGSMATYTGSGAAFRIGADVFTSAEVLTSAQKRYYFNVTNSTQSNWADSFDLSGSTAVLAINTNTAELHVNTAIGFTNAVILYGKDYGTVHNDVYLGRIMNNKIDVWVTKTGTGWSNSNEIHKGAMSVNTGINTGLARYGFVVGSPTDTYNHNNNIWWGGAFEKGGNAYINRFFAGIGNWMIGFRDEDSNPIVGVFEGTAQKSRLLAGYGATTATIIDSSSTGTNKYMNPLDLTRIGADAYTVASWNAINNSASYDSTHNGVSGIGLFNSSGQPVSNVAQTALGIYPDFVEIRSSGAALGWIIDTRITKEFLVKNAFADNKSGRLLVTLYDSVGVQLTATEYTPRMDNTAPTYNASWGGGFITGTNTSQDLYLLLTSAVKSAKITTIRASDVVRLKSTRLQVIEPSEGDVQMSLGGGIYSKYNIATQAPVTSGTYNIGHIVFRNVPDANKPDYWRCSKDGTARVLTGATASISAGTNKLVVSGVSLDSMYINERVLYNSNTYRIIGKRGDTLYLNSTIGSTLSGLTLTYSQPEWVEVGGGNVTLPQLSDSLNKHNAYFQNIGDGDTIFYKINDTSAAFKSIKTDTSVIDPTDTTIVLNLSGKEYTPSLTDGANVASSSSPDFRYIRVGNVVSVSGKVIVTPTTGSTNTIISVSLPIPSTLSIVEDLWGSGTANESNQRVPVDVVGTDVLNEAIVSFTSISDSAHTITIQFMYTIN